MSDHRRRQFAFARLLSGAVVGQAMLSAASFGIALILIPNTSDAQYGYYVLATSVIPLLASLQNAFFNPPLAIRLPQLDGPGRGKLVGGLYREQRRIVFTFGASAAAIALALWYVHVLDAHTAPLTLVTVAAALAILHREYFRMVSLAHRRSQDVLYSDVFHVVLIMIGAYVAILTPIPAVSAVTSLGFAAVMSGILLSRTFYRHEPWDVHGMPGILNNIAPLSAWSTAGAAIHWTFSQGYIYLVAATLDVATVAALAATRMLMMPMNLLSTGIGSLMLPLASGWLHRHGAALLWRRLCLLALALAAATLCYFAVLWSLREWIFTDVLKKQFAQRDELLMLWGAVFLVLVIRDQLVYLLAAQGRFRILTSLTLVSAICSLAASYSGMLHFGVTGALLGMLVGELISVTGIVILSSRKAQPPLPAAA